MFTENCKLYTLYAVPGKLYAAPFMNLCLNSREREREGGGAVFKFCIQLSFTSNQGDQTTQHKSSLHCFDNAATKKLSVRGCKGYG